MTINNKMSMAATAIAMATIGCPWLFAQAFRSAAPSIHHHNHRSPTSLSLTSSPLISSTTSSTSSTSSTATPAIISTSTNQQFHFKTRRKMTILLYATTEKASSSTRNKAQEEDEQQQQHGNHNEGIFQKRLAELNDFRSQYGHGSIPTPYPPNPSLGIWAANLRRQHAIWKKKSGNNNNNNQRGGAAAYIGYLTPQRQRQLILAGFDFSSLTERQFHSKLRELEAFQQRYGHCMVPEKWEENAALGAWVMNLRSLYNRRKKEEIPDGSSSSTTTNNRRRQQNKQKQRRSKNILRQTIYPLKKKTRAPRYSHLDEERIKLLEDMGFVWSSTDRKWLEMLEWAKVYGVVNSKLGAGLNNDFSYDDDDGAVATDHDGNITLAEGYDDGYGSTINLEQQQLNGTGQYSNNYNNQNQNHTLLLVNYRKFVHNIQNQSLLSSFHPQDTISELLLDESYDHNMHQSASAAQQMFHLANVTGPRRPGRPSSKPKNDTQHRSSFEPTTLDYRVPPADALHHPLRIWMVNQRSNYKRFRPSGGEQTQGEESDQSSASSSPSSIPSTMTAQRKLALEEIHFPWSGRFRNRIVQVQHAEDLIAEIERQKEKELRKERKRREEKERVKKILATPIVASGPISVIGSGEVGGVAEEEVVDVMALWDAEDDDDDIW